ncbi:MULTISPECIES: MSHA biogenesis protein MshK [unclassified Janthinobacterium]|uniref:MSHA biogenesis protein MshK n=1 Tax=unclassified Janthinobacterium TaxID=2610881 RepID=UPI001E351927|nr:MULTISPECIES: MSHA biogenesis protein MshK [unclassified Janthinobacterium]MCC7644373.1 MSHA biogenesis protein MshK [Janthinobacterium sp. EB271-G4-3-1]MCC7694095.1 MSHA biogenesis protein MshK [Janthinobacterium sp. EB271-G4-3-2]
MDRTLTFGPALLAPLLMLNLAWPGAQAQALDDPTRPPAALWAPASAAPVVAARPQLQSVLISTQPGGRRLAVIDGQTVKVGSKVGDAVVTEIHDTAVLLRRGKSLETFKLYPSSKTDNKADRKTDSKTGSKQE